jgi:hypothetical protein
MFAPGADICLNFCPTGFKEISGNPSCIGGENTGIVADFTFNYVNSKDRTWQFSDNKTFETNISYAWIVKMFGGASELSIAKDDPYAFDDRGLFFDGRYDYLTVKMLTLHHSFTLATWVKPHGNGTLFSSVRTYGSDIEHSFNWGISDRRMEFEDKSHHYYFRTKDVSVDEGSWQNLALSAEWRQTHLETNIAFYRNNILQDCEFYDHIIRDYPDYINEHFIGVNKRKDLLVNYYHGFMYGFRAYNEVVPEAVETIGYTCEGDCDVCPWAAAGAKCLGTCYWN